MNEQGGTPVTQQGDPTGTVVLPEGRTVAFFDGGDPAGYPVVGLHGTPGCRLNRMIDDSVYAEAGVRYVTTDRAGYGLSTRRCGRCVADEAWDVLAVADALGFERFGVVGGSGGGPHALACAALLAGRVERAACQSSLAPLGTGGLTRAEWLTGMDPEIAAELAWAEAGEEVLTREMEGAQKLMASRLAEDPGAIMGSEASSGDVEFLRRPEVIAAFRRIVPEQARNGVGGSVDDTLAFVKDWGFDLAAIAVPVLLTYGAEDSSCPVAHGRFLASSITTAIAAEMVGEGHFSADPRNEVLATHRWLRTGGMPDYPGR
jgi:pimeloyl-ACP methyl ester carboxylesterase